MYLNNPVIAVEEHYWDEELASFFAGADSSRERDLPTRLRDLADLRLREMDEHGIDMQVLSHGGPAGQGLDPTIAVDVCRRVNDRLAETIAKYPRRFTGFAVLPTLVPDAAADELERAVKDLGLKGTMLHGTTGGLFHDDSRFWPIFESADKLGVPIYIHPSFPNKEVSKIYYGDYMSSFPQVMRAGWGYAVETGTQAIRIILSGVLDKYPNSKLVLGHMGEALPFMLWRIDQALSRPGQESMDFSGLFKKHFHVTTSGFFSSPALDCCISVLGIDRIMFAVDYPFVANGPAMDWIKTLNISDEDRSKLLGGNAQQLLGI